MTPRTQKFSRRLFIFIDQTPIILPAALAVFGTICVIFLLFGKFQPWLVWPTGLILVLATWIIVAKDSNTSLSPSSKRERDIANCIAIVFVFLWTVFNIFYTAQHVFTNRDPGVYAVTGAWLIKQDNLELDASNIFGKIDGIRPYSGGFSPDPKQPGELAAQGTHILPAFIGLAGKIFGDEKMLRINVLFGASALLAVYGFARLIIRPRWALVAMGALAMTAPLLYFSRDAYTEPLSLTFTFGALALLAVANISKKIHLWFFAGLVAGAATLARIDAYLTIAALCMYVIIFLALSQQIDRRQNLVKAGALLCGMTVTSLLGYLDFYLLSPSYYLSEWERFKPQLLLITFIVHAGSLVVFIIWKTKLLERLDAMTKAWRSKAAIIIICALGLLLTSRPLWYTGYRAINERNYTEYTVNWIVWYLGPVLTISGFVGLIIGIKKVLDEGAKYLIPAILIIATTTLLYLVRPSIYPDQIWASRRFLPTIIPGLAVFGAYTLQKLYDVKQVKYLNAPGKGIATVLATLAIIGPAFTSYPAFMFIREHTWYSPMKSICRSLPEKSAVLWVGTASSQLVEPTKAFCDAPSEGFGRLFYNKDRPNAEMLAKAAQNAKSNGYKPLLGLFGEEVELMNLHEADFTVSSKYSYVLSEQTFTKPPIRFDSFTNSILLGEIQADGSIKQLKN